MQSRLRSAAIFLSAVIGNIGANRAAIASMELGIVLEYRSHKPIMPNVTLTHDAAQQLGDVPRPIKARVVDLLVRLAEWPNVSGAKPLSGGLTGHYRLRTGDYRLQFRVTGGQVVVERIGHRDGFYDEGDE